MKIEVDKDVDAAYVYLDEGIENGEVAKTIEVNDNIVLDFNSEDKLLGIEVLNASGVFSEDLIRKAHLV